MIGKALSVTSDGRYVATVSNDGMAVQVFDSSTKRSYVLNSSSSNISALDFKQASTVLACVDHSGDVELWDVRTRKKKGWFNVGTRLADVQFSPDGDSIAIAAYETVQIRTLNGSLTASLKHPRVYMVSVTYSDDGEYLAAGGYSTTLFREVGLAVYRLPASDARQVDTFPAYGSYPEFRFSASDSTILVSDDKKGDLVEFSIE
jgi:WD40 repeat protein